MEQIYIDRINNCIKMMEEAKNLDMRYLQGNLKDRTALAKTIPELHARGNTACFAGYMAISEFFKKDGGTMSPDGSPQAQNANSNYAFASVHYYLGISANLARNFVYGYECCGKDFYPVPLKEVKPHHVIEKLKLILSGDLATAEPCKSESGCSQFQSGGN